MYDHILIIADTISATFMCIKKMYFAKVWGNKTQYRRHGREESPAYGADM